MMTALDRPRLLVVVNVFEPDLGGGILFSDLCYGLAERGFDVTVRCAFPYYPEWADKSGENGLRIKREFRNGVHIERYGIFIPPNPNSLAQRLAYEASFAASLLRSLPDRRFDAVMAFCPLIGGVAYAVLRKKLYHEPLWLNVQDVPAAAAEAGGITRGGSGWMTRVQNSLFNGADVWSTISPVMAERLAPTRRRNQPLLMLPNWLHRSIGQLIDAAPADDADHQEIGDPVRLFYSGNIGTKQNLVAFCDALRTSRAAFRFLIRGSGSRFDELLQWNDRHRDPRFTIEPLSTEEALVASLRESDFFVVTERSGAGGSFIPSKLIPAFACGTPVLAVSDVDSPLGREMRDAGAGPHITWERLSEAAELLDSRHHLGHAYRKWREGARTRALQYDRDAIIDQYAAGLQMMIQGRMADLPAASPSLF